MIFMAARHDHHRVQTGDGYAAFVAGALVGSEIGVTTDAQSSWWGGRGIGTVPHALIAAYGGNTVLAATKFAEWAPPDFNIVVLVDFENDSVRTALEVARALGPRLWGVRLDTSGQLVDRSLWNELGDFDPRGVNERLVRKVRDALDRDGFERVKIVASGGFTVERIQAFEQVGVPVDAYGVGSSLIRGSNDFTGDIVLTDGRESAKVGRRYRRTPPRARRLAGQRVERSESRGKRAGPLGRRHAGRLHAPRREAVRARGRGDDPGDGEARRRCARGRARPRRVGRRSRADRPRDLGRPGLPHDLPAALPAGTRGARKIPETEQEDPVPVGLGEFPERYLEGREYLLLKKNFDVFTNPNTDRLVARLGLEEVILFGVATDVCDDAAIRGLLEREVRVRFVEDAARGLDEERTAACTAAWREGGVEFTTVDEVLAAL